MRFVTYRHSTESADVSADRVGVVRDGVVYGLPPGTTMIGLLGDDGSRLAEAGERALAAPSEELPLSEVVLRAPVPNPPSIRDFAAFEAHIRDGLATFDLELGKDWYELPIFWFGSPHVNVGSGEIVRAPGNTAQLDYELEVAAIIGLPGEDLHPAEAERHIAGYCIFNDCSARDLQKRETLAVPVGPSKGKDFANALGPMLVTPDELEPFRRNKAFDLTMSTTVNGKQYSRGNLSDIYWSFGEMVSYASRASRIVAGDIIGSGTCGGGCIAELSARFGTESYPWLQDGDQVVLEVEQLGRLENRMTFRPPPLELRPD
jgi:2-keto-4-pentenoate hydratase/2-oxohepta-3-ene-1,7-dioic acid hydratase in catechol pathway